MEAAYKTTLNRIKEWVKEIRLDLERVEAEVERLINEPQQK